MAKKNLLASRMQSTVSAETKPKDNEAVEKKNSEPALSKRQKKKQDIENGLFPKKIMKKASKSKKAGGVHILGRVIIIVLCIYVCFLIYGLLSTNYKYDEVGNIYPEVLSVNDIHDLSQYETLFSYYLRLRSVYEESLKTDEALVETPEKALKLSMDYTEQLDTIDKLLIDLNAAEYDTRYGALYLNIGECANGIAQYLQHMSAMISAHNPADAQNAISFRSAIYNSFSALTANVATLSEGVKGVDTAKIFEWNPEDFCPATQNEVTNIISVLGGIT